MTMGNWLAPISDATAIASNGVSFVSQIQASGDTRKQRAARNKLIYAIETVAGVTQMENALDLPPDRRRMIDELVSEYVAVAKMDIMN